MKKCCLVLISSLFTFSVFGQNLIKGYVLDGQKEPLIGVNVLVEGTTNGTITDVNGNFQISASDADVTLVFSYLGYLSQEIQVNASNKVEVILEESISALDEITVSGFVGTVGQARRRAESIQSIPESVVTLTSEQIQSTGVNNIQSFATLVPNLSFITSQAIGINSINIRGISQIRDADSPIAFVVDGVTIPDANLVNQELYDLAMLEVVKGPQGTLYGKNAIGGAVNILTLSPTNYFKNSLTVGYGNGNTFNTRLLSSGPIVKDKVYYRIAGSYKNSDGVINNVTLNDQVDFLETINLRGQLQFDISPRFTATLVGQYADTEGGAVYYAHSPNDADPVQLAADDFDYIIDSDQRGVSNLENILTYLKMEYSFDKFILRSVTSYNKSERRHTGDLDFGAVDILRQRQNSDSETFNQEFRLSSTNSNSKLSWDIGAFYQNSERLRFYPLTGDFGFFVPPPALPAPTGIQSDLSPIADFTVNFETIAFFGFLDYKVTDKFTVSLGLRFDNDNITQNNRLFDLNSSKNQSEFQPKVSLSYQATDDILVYGNYGRGYRSGGFNGFASAAYNLEFDGEISNNFEIGLKTSTINDRLIVNIAGFYVDFQNQQQFAVSASFDDPNDTAAGNYNLAATRIWGVEADLKFRTSRYLDILGGFGLNRSEIVTGGIQGTTDYAQFEGKNTPLIPQSNFNVALQSNFPISEAIDFSGFVNWSNTGEIYWHPDNNDVGKPYGLLDARLGFTLNNKYGITFWGNNLTDTDYYLEYAAGEFSALPVGDIAWIGTPRTFGVEFSAKF